MYGWSEETMHNQASVLDKWVNRIRIRTDTKKTIFIKINKGWEIVEVHDRQLPEET